MEINADQIEWIVREVVRRLRDGEPRGELALREKVITAALLDGQLAGVGVLRVDAAAVVTPSARDLLKDRGVELVRS